MLFSSTRLSGSATGSGGGTISGSIKSGQVAFGVSSDTIGGTNDFGYTQALALLYVHDPSGNNMILLDGTTQTAQLGGFTNGTYIAVDDGAQTATIKAVTSLIYTGAGGNRYLSLSPSTKLYGIGDLDSAGAGTQLVIDDGAKTLTFSGVAGAFLKMNNHLISGVKDPVDAQDAVTLYYLNQQIALVSGALTYQGTWDASSNTPTLISSVGVMGQYYVVSVAGTTNLNGISSWAVNDWAIFNGTVWQKLVAGNSYLAGSGLNLITGTFSLNTSHANDWLAKQTFENGMFELAGATSGFLRMNADSVTTTYSLNWPPTQGAAGTFPQNDGLGNLTWVGGSGIGTVTSITPGTGLSSSPDGTSSTAITSTGTLYNRLAIGLAGGQTVIGGTAASQTLTLSSTSHATKGKLLFGTSAYDEANNRLGIGQTTPTAALHLKAGTATASTAPLKFTSGTNLTTAEAGATEYNGTSLFFTNGGAQRQELPQIQQSHVTSQFDVSSTTTLANVPGLTATLVAGKTYRFEAQLYLTAASGGGVKFAIGGTATATTIAYKGLSAITGTSQSINSQISTALGGAVGAATVAAIWATVTGTITVNAAGTLTLQFAQNVSNGSNCSVLVGSTFVVTQIA